MNRLLQAQQNCIKNKIPRNGLIAEYLFNGNVLDTSGNGLHGTNYSATLTSDRYGRAERSYGFNGINNYIKIPRSISFQVNYTVSLWANFYDNQDITYFLSDINNGVRYSSLDNTFLFNANQGASGLVVWNKTNKEVNLIIERTSTTNYNFYIDTLFIGSSSTAPLETTLILDTFGRRDTGFYFKGPIDNIRFYNRILSQKEKMMLFLEKK